MKGLPTNVLLDADVLFSYLKGDELSAQAGKLVLKAEDGEVKLYVSSEVYDDIGKQKVIEELRKIT